MASFVFRPRFVATAVAFTGASAAYLSTTQRTQPAFTAEKKAVLQLHYFDIPGLAFPIRAALNHARIPFEDVRHERSDLPLLRGPEGSNKTVPLGQLPLLIFPNGTVNYCQSNAILRWAGKQSGLYPEDLEKALLVDEVLDSAVEFFGKIPQSKDAVELKKLREEYLTKDFAKQLKYFTLRLEQHSEGPFFLGNDLSIADLKLAQLVGFILSGRVDHVNVEHVKQYPAVWKHYEAVTKHPVYVNQLALEEKSK